MQNDHINLQQEILQQLKANHVALSENNIKLAEINHNMLKVFWIVVVFALLYFGLMLYLLFYR